jgi:hypothetical protein
VRNHHEEDDRTTDRLKKQTSLDQENDKPVDWVHGALSQLNRDW